MEAWKEEKSDVVMGEKNSGDKWRICDEDMELP